MSHKEILEKFLVHYNAKNVDELVDLYTDDATNHQIANEPAIGKEKIRKMFTDQFGSIKTECIAVNIFEKDEFAVMEWKDPKGFLGCSVFEFKDGKIHQQRGYWDKISFFKLHNIPLSLN